MDGARTGGGEKEKQGWDRNRLEIERHSLKGKALMRNATEKNGSDVIRTGKALRGSQRSGN